MRSEQIKAVLASALKVVESADNDYHEADPLYVEQLHCDLLALPADQPDAVADTITVPRRVWDLMQKPCLCGHDQKKCRSGWEHAEREAGEEASDG